MYGFANIHPDVRQCKKFLSYEKGMESYVLDRLEESINSGDKDIMKLLADVDAKRAIPRQRRTPNAAV